jgi:hypothetical protein
VWNTGPSQPCPRYCVFYMGVPQLVQNLVSALFGVPQLWQNLEPGGLPPTLGLCGGGMPECGLYCGPPFQPGGGAPWYGGGGAPWYCGPPIHPGGGAEGRNGACPALAGGIYTAPTVCLCVCVCVCVCVFSSLMTFVLHSIHQFIHIHTHTQPHTRTRKHLSVRKHICILLHMRTCTRHLVHRKHVKILSLSLSLSLSL